MATDVVWVDVLPSMKRFGPELERGTGSAAASAGTTAGTGFTNSFGKALKIGAVIGGAMAASAGISFMKEAVTEASNLGESLNAVNVVYGKNAEGINKLGKESANAFGLSQSQFNGLAVQFSSFATTIAGDGGDVVGTIKELSTRGSDFASVMNLDVNEAMGLFQSGLAGETEPLRAFGIDLSAAAVEAYAYANGIAAAGEPLTEQQKVQARYASLMEQTSKVQGDFTNTSDSLANSQRILGANWDNIQATVGAKVIPVLERLSGWVLEKGLPLLSTWGGYLDTRLSPALATLGAGAAQVWGILFRGDFKGNGPLSESDQSVHRLFQLREGFIKTMEGAKQVWDILFRGDFKGNGPLSESDKSVDVLFDIREAFIGIKDALGGLDFTSVGGFVTSLKGVGGEVGANLGSVGDSLITLAPAMGEFGAATRDIAEASLPLLTSGLAFLARHVDDIIALMPYIAAGYVLWRVAMVASIAKQVIQLPLTLAQIAANFSMGRGASALAAQLAILNGVQNVSILTKIKDIALTVYLRTYILLWRAATLAQAGAQWLLNAAITANPIGILILVLVALVAAVVIAYRESDTFRAIVQAAWKGIQDAVSWAWNNVIKPIFNDLSGFVTGTLGPVVMWLWNNIIKPAFSGISAAVDVAWNVIKLVFDVWVWTLKNVVGPAVLWLWDNAIKPAFDWISGHISNIWNNGVKPVFEALGNFIKDKVAPAFGAGVNAIGEAWDKVMDIARVPINFVIDTVYNNGIRAGFNTVAEAFGSDARLPAMGQVGAPGAAASGSRYVQARARGGYTPPGMTLVGEEGPEIIDLRTPGRVYTASQTDRMMHNFGGPLDGAVNVASNVASALTDPMGFIRRKVDGLMEGFPGGGSTFGRIIKALPGKLLDMAKAKVDSLFAAVGLGDAGTSFTGGSGAWRRPGQGRVSSEFGMRRHPISGVTKLHNGIDLAAGHGKPIVAAAGGQVINARPVGSYGNFIQIQHPGNIKTGYAHLSAIGVSNGQLVQPGQLIGREGNTGGSTGPHLHFNVNRNGGWVNPRSIMSFDDGGLIPMGVHQIAHAGAKPDRVFNDSQWTTLDALAARGAQAGATLPEYVTLEVDGQQFRAYVRAEAADGARHSRRMSQGS